MDSNEIFDIGVSVFAISIAFSINQMKYFWIILATVGLGFIAHELAHRFVANHYGAKARFVAWPEGLLLMFVMAVITNGQLIFAAPGAVYIYSNYLTKRQNGIISISGALMNCLLAILFLSIGIAIGVWGTTQAEMNVADALISFGAFTNLYLALFNMIPVPPLDGSKVLAWNWVVWAVFFVILLIPFIFVLSG